MIRNQFFNYLHSILNVVVSVLMMRIAVKTGYDVVLYLGIWQSSFSALSFGIGAFSGSLARLLNLEYANSKKITNVFESYIISGIFIYIGYSVFFSPCIVKVFFSSVPFEVSILFIVYSCVMYVNAVFRTSLQAQCYHYKYFLIEIIGFLLVIFCLLKFDNFNNIIFLSLTCSSILVLAMLLVTALPRVKISRLSFKSSISNLLKTSPVYLVTGVLTTLAWSDILILSKVADEKIVVVFIILFKLPELASLFVNKFTVVRAQKWVELEVNNKLKNILNESHRMLAVLAALTVPFYLFLESVVFLLFEFKVDSNHVAPLTILFFTLSALRLNIQILFTLARMTAVMVSLAGLVLVKLVLYFHLSENLGELLWAMAISQLLYSILLLLSVRYELS